MIDNKWGFINKSGQVVIKLQFDLALDFKESVAAVRVGQRFGFIDKSGQMVIQLQFGYEKALRMVWQESQQSFSLGHRLGYCPFMMGLDTLTKRENIYSDQSNKISPRE